VSKRPEEEFEDSLLNADAKERWLNGEPLPGEPLKKEAQEIPLPPSKPVTVKNLFANPESHPVAVDFALLKAFKMEWLAWLPDTLFSEIESTFRTSVAEVNKTKVMAAQTLHVVDAFWTQYEVFEKTVAALNGTVPRLSVMQPPDLPHLLAAVDMVGYIRKEPFNEEVSRYVAGCFLRENVHYAPSPCDFAQIYISQPKYRCKDCSKVGPAMPPFDGLCDSCVERFQHEHPFSFAPDPEKLALGRGRNVERFMTYDFEAVKKRFEELVRLPPEQVDITETDVDLQAYRLLYATDYQKMKHRQLVDQLTSLRSWLEG
jgi:hypothetical protein